MDSTNTENFYILKEKTLLLKDMGFEFNDCLSEKRICSFEKKFKIKLPEDYRNYLKIIGNGGFGPGEGPSFFKINKLEDSDPYTEHYFHILDKRSSFRKVKKRFPYSENQISNEEIIDRLWSINPKNDNIYQGSLILSHQGCGNYFIMEVTGENPGRIWFAEFGSGLGVSLIKNSFYDWFNDFIEKILNLEELYLGINNEDMEIIKKHIHKNNVNAHISNWDTSLIYIALSGNKENVIKYLIDLGVDINLKTSNYGNYGLNGKYINGSYPVEYAVNKAIEKFSNNETISEELEIIKLLFNQGANLNFIISRNIPNTILDDSIKSDCLELTKLLKSLGAKSINEINK